MGQVLASGACLAFPGAHPVFSHGPCDRGATLAETLVATGIVVVAVGISVPFVTTGRHEQHVMNAARHVAGRIVLARAGAARRGATIGIRFTRNGERVALRSYVDGNGNGVRAVDIGNGIDTPIETETSLGDRFGGVRFELSPAAPAIGSSTPAGAGADPVNLGGSDILSLTPLGTATSGTLYLRSREGHQAAVRVLGATARVQVFHFDFQTGRWSPR